MDPIILQKMLKENNKDLQNFCEDLKSWGEEMKQKDSKKSDGFTQVKKREKSPGKQEKPATKSCDTTKKNKSSMSYTDWEKYDVEKECAKLDEKENSSDEENQKIEAQLKESAFMEKENGNKYVKNKNWKKAIECYTKAIDYHPYDAVFYANRALCYLKINEFSKAESDCTVSLKIDSTYVKAYQRRAFAREAQNKYQEATDDYSRVLEFEPKNNETKKNLEELNKKIAEIEKKEKNDENSNNRRPLSVFTASRNRQKSMIDEQKPSKTLWPSGEQKCLVKPIEKPPHLRSKKPRKIIEIQEVNSSSWPEPNTKPLNRTTVRSDDLKIVEKKEAVCDLKNSMPGKIEATTTDAKIEISAPKTAVQFFAKWKILNKEQKLELMNLIEPKIIPVLFKESLDSFIFSEILFILSEFPEWNGIKLYDYLENFSKIKRFSALVMFLTVTEKNYVWKMLNFLKENNLKTSEEINKLIVIYEL